MDDATWRSGSSMTESRMKRLAVAGSVTIFLTLSSNFLGAFPASTDDAFRLMLLLMAVMTGGLYLFTSSFILYRKRHLMTSSPTANVRSVSMGYAELKGTVTSANETLAAPFTGDDAVVYSYKVEEYRYDGDDHDWDEVADGRRGTIFVLDDGTGQVHLDPRGAQLDIPQTKHTTIGAGSELPGPIQKFEGQASFSDKRRYTEYALTPGDDVYVLGKALERPGISSAQNEENVIVHQDENTPFFYISTSEEDDLVHKLFWYTLLSFIGGIIGFSLGLAFLLMFFGLF